MVALCQLLGIRALQEIGTLGGNWACTSYTSEAKEN